MEAWIEIVLTVKRIVRKYVASVWRRGLKSRVCRQADKHQRRLRMEAWIEIAYIRPEIFQRIRRLRMEAWIEILSR